MKLFFLCSVLFASIAFGQMNILSEPSGADVLIDSAFVGKTPLRGLALSEGRYVVKVFYPSIFAWNSLVKVETVQVSLVGSTEKFFELGGLLAVNSVPPGGRVTYQGSELGTTPLYVRSPSRFNGELLVQKEGYNEERVALNAQATTPLVVRLQPKQFGEGVIPADVLSGDHGMGVSNHWLTYTSGASMIVSGVLSAYFKDKANRDFDGFLQSNDPGLLSSTHRLDRWASITLVISQISFAILAYVLLSE
ncbi:MAG: PEGA domain-containing protein [Ignavibacteriales bacterium]|nr:PEGA domain-containing protein [Ignavibacteriales bacterium]